MDFLVERPLAEVMIQAEKYMVVQQGFNRTLDSTETRQSFFRKREGIANIAEAIGLWTGPGCGLRLPRGVKDTHASP